MIVHVATRNPVKVRAVKAAFGRRAKVTSVNADGGAPPQPISLGQIVRGATMRAKRALGAKAAFGVGIEAGLFRLGGVWYNAVVAAVTDGKRTSLGGGPFFPLPDRLANAIVGGDEELGSRFAGRGGGAIAAVTRGAVTREEATRLAVVMALAPWTARGLYE